MSIFKVTGNQGTMTICSTTGNVLRYVPDEDHGYADIVQLDVVEWRQTYPNEAIEGEHDILDFGYYTADSKYYEAEASWRAEFRRDMERVR